MKTLKVFILGLLCGWSLKSIIDRMYQNKQVAVTAGDNTLPRPPQRAKRKEDLQVMRGIGPAAEKKLNAAGIHTFAELAQLTVEELQTILGRSRRVTQSAGNMIKEAKKLAQ